MVKTSVKSIAELRFADYIRCGCPEGAPKGCNEGESINTLKLKSLIMAQIERWRQASYMQVER